MSMRKVLLLLFLTITLACMSQSFVATPDNGLVDANDNTKNYVVIPFEGKSAERLYALTQNFRQKQYVNPDRVIRGDIINEFLSINTFTSNFITITYMGISMPVKASFTVGFSFKDNKVKFEITDVDMRFENKGMAATDIIPYISNGISWGIFYKNGKPMKDLQEQYQNYFNKYLQNYINFINNYEKSNDDW